jgi:predicted nuclease with TOPRIM domain
LLLEAISKINDPELKTNMLHKLRKMLNKEKTNDLKTPKLTISLSETLERFNKLKPKKANLEDLQFEINQIKNEIQQLKTENTKLKNKNASLEDRVSILELNKRFKLINNQGDSLSEDEKPKSSTQKLIKLDD